MKKYLEFKPNQFLQSFIDYYWTLEITGKDINLNHVERVIPLGFPEIILHFGDLFLIKNDDHFKILPRLLLTGQLLKSKSFKPTGKSGVFGIKFKASGLRYFLNESPSKYTDKCTPLDQIYCSNKIQELEHEFIETNNVRDKIRIIEIFLQDQYNDIKTNIDIDQILNLIKDSKGGIQIKHLAKESNSSLSKLERNFKNIIGITPKSYAQIIRFNEILKDFKKNVSIKDIANKYNYFDSAHLIKEFTNFSGFTPDYFKYINKSNTENLIINQNADFLQSN